jgi:hypothetical protein
MSWIKTIPLQEAQGELLETYRAMASRPLPPVYRPPHGGAPGIVQLHSLDPRLLRAVFGASGALHAEGELPWADREILSTVVSRANQCLY